MVSAGGYCWPTVVVQGPKEAADVILEGGNVRILNQYQCELLYNLFQFVA